MFTTSVLTAPVCVVAAFCISYASLLIASNLCAATTRSTTTLELSQLPIHVQDADDILLTMYSACNYNETDTYSNRLKTAVSRAQQ